MDEGTKGQYAQFFKSSAGQDLIKRFITTEAKYQMEGMKGKSLEEKGIAMAKIEAVYSLRTMLEDLSSPVQSQSAPSAKAGSK